jgi:hypothetical protein
MMVVAATGAPSGTAPDAVGGRPLTLGPFSVSVQDGIAGDRAVSVLARRLLGV